MSNVFTFSSKILDDAYLIRNLCAAQYCNIGLLWVPEDLLEVLDLFHHQKPCSHGLDKPRHPFRGGMGSVGRTKGIIDIDLTEGCQSL